MHARIALVASALALVVLALAPCGAATIPLRTYLSLTDVAWASASPDGRRIAYTSEESGSWQLWVTNADGSRRRQLTAGPDTVDFARWVPGDPRTILYATSHGGSGVDRFAYARDDRPGAVPLFPHEGSVTHVFGAFSPDGTQLAFSSNRRTPSAFDVSVLDRKTGAVRRVDTVAGTAYAGAWSPDAKQLVVRLVRTPYDDDLFTVDLRTGVARLITPHGGQATFDDPQFTTDMRGVLCISDRGRAFRTIQRIDLATRTLRPVLYLAHDVDELALAPDGRRMAYIVNRDGFGEVVIADARTGRTVGRPAMPPSIAETPLFVGGGRTLLYAASGPTFPKVPWSYDLRSGVTTRILRPNFHRIQPTSIVEPALVRVRSFDGTIVPAWYFQPAHPAGRLTVLVDVHGGPEEQDRAWFYPFAQYLVSRGYALLDPNIRGSTGYGRGYLHLADGRKREDAVKDVAALRRWLIARGDADPSRIFVNGASYGWYVVLASLYREPTAWAGGIDIYGVADWVDFLQKTAPDRRANREGVYGSLAHDHAFLATISPINHVAAIRRPVLIVAGANDTIVPVAQSERMARALRQHGVPVELHVFPNEGHGIAHLDDLVAIYRWTLAFMQRYGR